MRESGGGGTCEGGGRRRGIYKGRGVEERRLKREKREITIRDEIYKTGGRQMVTGDETWN